MSEKLLSIKSLAQKINRSRSFIYQAISEDAFPKPVKIGRSSLWVETEILEWIENLIKKRDQIQKAGNYK